MKKNTTAEGVCSNAQLAAAVAASMSWRGVMRHLGLSENSPRPVRSMRQRAERLGIDTSHFAGQRRWAGRPSVACESWFSGLQPRSSKIRDAGAAIAAAWFLLRGCSSSIPIEPTHYDLLVSAPDGIKRIQVKTTTFNGKDGWVVQVARRPYSAGNQARLIPYDTKSLDFFFILDGELNVYLIPCEVIAGRVTLVLRCYTAYIVGNAAGLARGLLPRSSAS